MMYLSNAICSLQPDPAYQKPTSDYKPYFHEMHQFTGGYLDDELLTQKSGYAFPELLDRAITKNKKILSLLQQVDICIIINASYDYDSQHSHIASYIKECYQINADLFDIAGQGSFSLISALHLALAFFSQSKVQRGLIIGFEQRALPLRMHQHTPLPLYNGVGFLDLFSHHKKSSLKIIASDVISEKYITCKLHELTKNHRMHYYLLSHDSDAPIPHFLPHQPISFTVIPDGILPLFLFFDQLQKQVVATDDTVLQVVLIENSGLHEWGVIILLK